MKEWCLTHPVMTFWLVVLMLFVLESAISNLTRIWRKQ